MLVPSATYPMLYVRSPVVALRVSRPFFLRASNIELSLGNLFHSVPPRLGCSQHGIRGTDPRTLTISLSITQGTGGSATPRPVVLSRDLGRYFCLRVCGGCTPPEPDYKYRIHTCTDTNTHSVHRRILRRSQGVVVGSSKTRMTREVRW